MITQRTKSLILAIVLLATLIIVNVAVAECVRLYWNYTQGADPATSFVIYRASGSCNSNSTFVFAGWVLASQPTFTNYGVSPGETYCWQITARNVNGIESVPSNQIAKTIPTLSQGCS